MRDPAAIAGLSLVLFGPWFGDFEIRSALFPPWSKDWWPDQDRLGGRKHNEKFRFLAIDSMLHHPWGDLVRHSESTC